MNKMMYFGTLIGAVLAFLLISLSKGEMYWVALMPILVGMFAGNLIASLIYRKKHHHKF